MTNTTNPKIDANLLPENIKDWVPIFGVMGTLKWWWDISTIWDSIFKVLTQWISTDNRRFSGVRWFHFIDAEGAMVTLNSLWAGTQQSWSQSYSGMCVRTKDNTFLNDMTSYNSPWGYTPNFGASYDRRDNAANSGSMLYYNPTTKIYAWQIAWRENWFNNWRVSYYTIDWENTTGSIDASATPDEYYDAWFTQCINAPTQYGVDGTYYPCRQTAIPTITDTDNPHRVSDISFVVRFASRRGDITSLNYVTDTGQNNAGYGRAIGYIPIY
jgi:hypothetical protein